MRDLCTRVSEQLIPALREEGEQLAGEDLAGMTDSGLAGAIEVRKEAHERWKVIYKDEFIPFAHGVRRFGQYYNDAVQPDDPYEFVVLLQDQPLLASRRNEALAKLARRLRENPAVATRLAAMNATEDLRTRAGWRQAATELAREPAGAEIVTDVDVLLDEHLDLVFRDESLDDRPDLAIGMILQLVEAGDGPERPSRHASPDLEKAFLDAVGSDRRAEALDTLRIGRLSWRLRDDDNILMGRLENQLQHALAIAADRLAAAGRLARGISLPRRIADLVVASLNDPVGGPLVLPPKEPAPQPRPGGDGRVAPRQLVGQPAARGVAVGTVRVVRNAEDFAAFRRGEVLVCDAIQPTMTHLVPLAAAIVERRGGMLIHGAIIARELGVPCVNGIPEATGLLHDGDLVTVDGHLGIVTVGPAEFKLEDAED